MNCLITHILFFFLLFVTCRNSETWKLRTPLRDKQSQGDNVFNPSVDIQVKSRDLDSWRLWFLISQQLFILVPRPMFGRVLTDGWVCMFQKLWLVKTGRADRLSPQFASSNRIHFLLNQKTCLTQSSHYYLLACQAISTTWRYILPLIFSEIYSTASLLLDSCLPNFFLYEELICLPVKRPMLCI